MLDPHCMSCRHSWTRDVFVEYFPAAWVNGEFKKHREKILIGREKQLLPESMHMVTRYRELSDIRKSIPEKLARLDTLKRQVATLGNEIYTDRNQADRIERTIFNPAGADAPDAKKIKVEFACPCPKDECRGFMDAKMVCGVCLAKACTHCGVLLGDDEHECNKDVAASFKAIQKQTKPCPKCAVPTYKVSGCNQMWCVSCHTSWDWTTGDVVKGIIHNPHYFAFLRERSATGDIPRQPGDEPGDRGIVNCDRRRFPYGYTLERALNRETESIFGKVYELPRQVLKSEAYLEIRQTHNRIMKLLARLTHIYEVTLPTLRQRYRNIDNADLRLKFLINDITEDKFQTELHRREKKREKDVAVRDIYEMTCDTAKDVIWDIVDGTKASGTGLEELHVITKYANTHLAKIQAKYNMKVNLLNY